MPIILSQPVSLNVPVVSQQSLVCDSLFVNSIKVDATDKTKPFPASISLLPFASNGGNPAYATDDQIINFSTADLFGAAVNIPEIGNAIQAIYAAANAWYIYSAARKAALTNAQLACVAAQASLAAAQSTLAAITVGADATAATAEVVTGQAALDTANTNVAKANAAFNDPANPIF